MPAPRSRSAAASGATSKEWSWRARRSGRTSCCWSTSTAPTPPTWRWECARAIEPFGIHWIEEPLPPGDFRGYAELRARSPIALAAGEAHHTVRDFRALIDGRCIDIVQPSIPGVGGITEAKRIVALAHAQNLRVAPHVWGGAVGLATACHFLAALPATPHTEHPPHPSMLEYDMSDNELRTKLLKTPLRLEDGHVLLPDGPGLGIELDWDAVERYRVC